MDVTHAVCFRPIGVLRTPFKEIAGMPIQPLGATGVRGAAEIFPEFTDGLQDLEGFSHLIVLYHFHHAPAPRLQVTPFLDGKPHGVFATRAPARPNPIGLSIVRLLRQEDCMLYLENVDMLDGTPLLDLKPYVPEFDICTVERVGWLE
ncbi:MAG: tRNA (N6-threonylcarbamoyladenosine(37)-N6)-methyltransferase TrmO, partial [Anaerolineae bacterium]|nr:tRNA (N6-threonylcarbamoyladenosine(37)-N6)-methyltransferase TrmO [Anaerolineae bacterium]